jgi:voltage-gated potassium channel
MSLKNPSFKERLFTIIFEADTRLGQLFDKTLIVLILISLLVVMLDSVESIAQYFHTPFMVLEWTFTILFSAEYIARLYCAPQRLKYARSFYGIIDLVAVLPTYLALIFPELHALID